MNTSMEKLNPNLPHKYDEVQVDKKTGKEIKVLRQVSIDEVTAEMLNSHVEYSGIIYRLAGKKVEVPEPEVKPMEEVNSEAVSDEKAAEKAERAELFAKLKAAGISMPGVAKTETLRAKVTELNK